MKRNDFIKSLGLGAGGLLLPKRLLTRNPVKIYDNYVKGLQHYKFSTIEKHIKVEDVLTIKRDYQNVHDAFAVEVYFKQYKLGYLPAYENIVIANMLDADVSISAIVSHLKLESNPYKMETLGIALYCDLISPTSNLIKQLNEKRADDVEDIYRKGYNF